MIEVDTELKLGEIGVVTSQNRGHPPEFWAERCTARICGISENADGHIRQQAEAFRLAIYSAILYHIKEAINSCLLYTSPSPRDGLLSRMPSSA